MSDTERPILVTVIVVCHDDGIWLPRCFESIRSQTIFNRIEILVADNASDNGTDEIAQKLVAEIENARFLSTGGDNGFGVACNRAAEIAAGKYLYLINPDTWLERDCLAHLFETAESQGAGVSSAAMLNYDDDNVQGPAAVGFDFCGNAVIPRRNTAGDSLLAPAAFFFIRRDLFIRVGMMDRKFFLYGEEMDLSWRVWISGEKVVPAFAAKIHHQGAVGIDSNGARKGENRTSAQKRFLANRNRLVFIAKDCQHVLLLMLFPCFLMILLEGLVTWAMTRSWSQARTSSIAAIAGAWQLRAHIKENRKHIAAIRRRSDWWMLRFFRFSFGRREEIAKVIRAGYPRFK